MSENMKSRQNRVRRNVTALVSAVALACGTTAVVAPSAGAQVTGTIQELDAREGEASRLDFNVSLEVDNPNPSDKFNYVLKTDARAPRWSTKAGVPGESDLLNFKVFITPDDGKTALDRDPQPSDFKWASGQTRPIYKIEKNGAETLVWFGDYIGSDMNGLPGDVTRIPSGDYLVEAKLPAHVVAGQSAPFHATGGAYARIDPKVDWAVGRQNLQTDPTDEGLMFYNASPRRGDPTYGYRDPRFAEYWGEYVLAGGGYGIQLAQLFLGISNPVIEVEDPATGQITQQPVASLQFAGGSPRDFQTGADNSDKVRDDGFWLGDGLAIRVTDPDGEVITDEVMAGATAITPPLESKMAEPYVFDGNKVSPDWFKGWEWPINNPPGVIDQSELWLRSGTKFEIHQLVYDPLGRFGRNGLYGDAASHFVNYREGLQHEVADDVQFGSTFIGDRVWVDVDGNGVQDANETTGVPGVQVFVSRVGEPDRVTTTDDAGAWRVDGLTVGEKYNVRFVLPTEGEFKDYLVTMTGDGSKRDQDSNGLTFTTDEVPGTGDLTYDLGIVQPASVGDRVWLDVNKDGKRTDDEPGVSGVTVTVSRDGEPDRTATTDKDGFWKVDGLTPGVEYTVTFEQPQGYDLTKTVLNSTADDDSNGLESKVTLKSGEFNQTYDLGLVVQPASVGDRVWIDENRNGIQDPTEGNLAGVSITVTGGGQTYSTKTDADGKWKVDGLTPGVEYTVEFTLPDGYKATQALVGDDQGKDSNGLKSTVTLNPGEFNQTYDLGVYQTASIGDYVWEDLNNDGIQQGNEPPITGVVVKVEGPNGETFYTSTNNEGKWLVDDLVPGTDYTVTFTPPTGYAPTKTAQGEDRAVDSNGLTFKTGEVPAEGDLTLDLGLVKTASVGDRVWLDEGEGSNWGNGIQDEGEPNVPGVKVKVSAEGEDDRSTVTDSNGNWRIDGLTPGVKYTVTFTPPAGYEVTKTNQGDDRGTDSNEATSTVTLKPGEYNKTYDLGLVKKSDPATASVGDRVWVDENANGVQDDDEKNGVPGINVTATPPEGSSEEPRTTKTDDKGNWRIDGLTPGVEYTVTFELPDGTTVTKTVQGDDRGKDSNEVTSTVTLEPGEYNDTYDLGVVSASVGDRVWLDEGKDANKANGIQDEDETTGVAGVVVRVFRQGEAVRETRTDDKGEWKIDGLTPGVNYRVEFDAPDGYSVSPSKKGEDRENDSNGLSDTITALKSGENNTSYDLGLYKPSPATTVSTTTAAPTTTPTTTVTTQVPTTVTTQVPTTVTTQVPTTVTTAGNCKTCTPTTVTTQVPTTVTTQVPTTVTKLVPTTVPTTLTSTTVVPTTVVQTTTNRVVVTDENTAIIGDKVYIDDNSDGKQDPNENEGVPNVTVIVTGEDGEEQRTVTDKDGNWHVVVQPGDYTVKYETDRVPSDPEQLERTVTVKPGEKKDDIDLGVLRTGTVGDRVWNDEDGDGEQGENEKGLENVVVLVSREGEPTRSAVTDENGDWKIEGLNPNAEYEVRFIKPEGWEVTGKVPGSDESGLISKVTVKPNEYNDTYDLGLKKSTPDCDCEPEVPGTIGDRGWVDENGDGKQDPGEKTGVPDVTVIVRDKDGNEVTRTVTDENGNWKVDVAPGDYEVEYRPRDWKPTDPSQVARKVTVEAGKEYLDLDLGVKPGEPAPSEPPVTVTTTVEKPAPTTTPKPWNPGLGEGGEFLDRCVANAVRSPFLYLVPVALLGAFGGELARPYMGAINEQVNRINAEFQAAFRRNTPEWGEGGQGARRDDPFAELRAQFDAANRQLQQIAADPDVQRFGTAAAGIIGLIAAGAVIYDWCSSEEGQAVTSIKGGGSSRKEAVTTVAPTVTTTETRN